MYFLKRARALLASTETSQPIVAPSQRPSPVTSSARSSANFFECLPHSTTRTIGNLSDKLLLKIFRHYLDSSPPFWPILGHICHRWRRIMLVSFRLYFTHGAPVPKSLECRPALPIVMHYGGSPESGPPAPEDEVNIVTALQQSDRVISISLTVTSSLLKELSAIEKPVLELEDLVLSSRNNVVRLAMPSAFQWGARLRCLHLTRITIPSLLQLLYSSRNLVDLQLHEVLNPQLFSPEVLTLLLSGMAQLRSLSLHFHTTAKHFAPPSLSGKRIVLSFLTYFDFLGDTEYLEGLVTGIDAPFLGHIEVAFTNTNTLELSKLCEFIDRIEIHKSHCRAHILSSGRAISISLMRPGATTPRVKLQIFCEQLEGQLSSVARICNRLSAVLFKVEELRVSTMRSSSLMDGFHIRRWLWSINSFRGVKWFCVDGNLSPEIVLALRLQDKTVLPALHGLYIPQPGPRHAPLSEDVVSFMTSRRLSGHPIAVKYEQSSHITELSGTVFSEQETIEMLSEDILLNIFRYCLDTTSRFWPTLAWVCQRWRQIVFTSPLGLNLRLYCTYGTPVLKSLDCWPSLPICVEYGGVTNLDPPTPQDDENIIAAFKQSGRVRSISLTVTRSLLKKLSAISEPFSELEDLVLLSQDNTQLTLPSTLRWGHRLRTLRSTGIGFSSLPQLLSPCQDLVDLQLHEIPSNGYFPPEEFANALSGMTHLRAFSLHFLSLPPRRKFLTLPPQPEERTVLPALTCLKYRGTSKYLDSLVARIDAPQLGDIDITFSNQPSMDASQLGRFIERIEMSPSHAEVETSAHAISISFTNSSTSAALRLQISCKPLDWQLSCMAQVCDQFSPFLFLVEDLSVNTTQSSGGQNVIAGEQWLELVRSFGGARDIRMDGNLTRDILRALGPADEEHSNVSPALRRLREENPMMMNEPSLDTAQSSVTPRPVSGSSMQVSVKSGPSHRCLLCHVTFEQLQELRRHLEDQHPYRRMCLYCDDFEYKWRQKDLFLKHLNDKHIEVACHDAFVSRLISSPDIFAPELRRIMDLHTSLRRAPGIITPSTTLPPRDWTLVPGGYHPDTDIKALWAH